MKKTTPGQVAFFIIALAGIVILIHTTLGRSRFRPQTDEPTTVRITKVPVAVSRPEVRAIPVVPKATGTGVVGMWSGTIQSKRSSSGDVNSTPKVFSIGIDPDIKSGTIILGDRSHSGPVGIIKIGDDLIINDPLSPGITMKLKMTLSEDGSSASIVLRMDNGLNAWGEAEGILTRQ